MKIYSKKELKKIINESPPDADLNYLDVSNVTNMSFLFCDNKFNGSISEWNVSNVITMEAMFHQSKFNGDISRWNVNKVIRMDGMFEQSLFNGNISNWNVSNVKDMSFMFSRSRFNQNLDNWNIKNVESMEYLLEKNKSWQYQVHDCGKHSRTIYRCFNKVFIGWFVGTKQEAIQTIEQKYLGKEKDNYINKIKELMK